MSPVTVLEANQIQKSYGSIVALDTATTRFEGNKIYGLFGRNGAGKSTLLDIMTGRIFADAGDVTCLGQDIVTNPDTLSDRCCYMPEKQYFPKRLKIKALLEHAKASFPLYDEAFAELALTNELSSWRGEGRLNQADLALRLQDYDKAEGVLRNAIRIEPYFDIPYINLADLYRHRQQDEIGLKTLQQGVQNNPRSAAMQYSLALTLIRLKQREKALDHLRRAIELEESVSQYWYAYAHIVLLRITVWYIKTVYLCISFGYSSSMIFVQFI